MFYAAEHSQDIRFCNDYCTLYRFKTNDERDAFVSSQKLDPRTLSIKIEAVTRDKARNIFPEAFRLIESHPSFYPESIRKADMRDWAKEDGDGYEYWFYRDCEN